MSPHEFDFSEVLRRMVEANASDVHVTAAGEADDSRNSLLGNSRRGDGFVEGETTHFSAFHVGRRCSADIDCDVEEGCFVDSRGTGECRSWAGH